MEGKGLFLLVVCRSGVWFLSPDHARIALCLLKALGAAQAATVVNAGKGLPTPTFLSTPSRVPT